VTTNPLEEPRMDQIVFGPYYGTPPENRPQDDRNPTLAPLLAPGSEPVTVRRRTLRRLLLQGRRTRPKPTERKCWR
jgi:hypothetical protein